MRQYSSFKDPSKRINYISEILDGLHTAQNFNGTECSTSAGEGKGLTMRCDLAGPLFKVTPEDDEDSAIIEKSATAAWSAVIAKVNDLKTEATGKRQFTSVSGPEYFGFGISAIAKLIQGIITYPFPSSQRTHGVRMCVRRATKR